MYIRKLAAIARLTLVVAGSLPVTTELKEKTLPDAGCRTGPATDSAGRDRFGCTSHDGATPQPCACSGGGDLKLADHASIDSGFI
jgi:hypothetical protein